MRFLGREGSFSYLVRRGSNSFAFLSAEDACAFLLSDKGKGCSYFGLEFVSCDGECLFLGDVATPLSCESGFSFAGGAVVLDVDEVRIIAERVARSGCSVPHACYAFSLAFLGSLALKPFSFDMGLFSSDSDVLGGISFARMTRLVRFHGGYVSTCVAGCVSKDDVLALLRQGYVLGVTFEVGAKLCLGDGTVTICDTRHAASLVPLVDGRLGFVDNHGMRFCSSRELDGLWTGVAADSVLIGVRCDSMIATKDIADWVFAVSGDELLELDTGVSRHASEIEWSRIASLPSVSLSLDDSGFFDRVAGYVAHSMPFLDERTDMLHAVSDSDERKLEFVRKDRQPQMERTPIDEWKFLDSNASKDDFSFGW